MSKTTKAAAAEEQQQNAAPAQITLEEFCIRLSSKDKRVELIGAFESGEIRAGRLRDTAEAFAGRYQDFIKKPA